VVNVLATKPGINGANTLSIPKTWDATWFRSFIANSLKGADVRNAVGTNGISITGNIASPYGTIAIGAGPIVIPATAGQVTLTVDGAPAQPSISVVSGNTTQSTPDIQVLRASDGTANAVAAGPNIILESTTPTFYATSLQNSGGQTELWQYNGGWHQVLYVDTSNIVHFNASGAAGSGAAGSVQSGTFTGTLTGCTTAPTATFHYTIAGNICTISMANGANLTGTSNSTSMTITGMPAVCEPATQTPILPCVVEDNGLLILAAAEINPGLGTIILLGANVNGTKIQYTNTGFTASGTKGINSTTFSYSLQ
jgi:hypothetical protein